MKQVIHMSDSNLPQQIHNSPTGCYHPEVRPCLCLFDSYRHSYHMEILANTFTIKILSDKVRISRTVAVSVFWSQHSNSQKSLIAGTAEAVAKLLLCRFHPHAIIAHMMSQKWSFSVSFQEIFYEEKYGQEYLSRSKQKSRSRVYTVWKGHLNAKC